MFHHWGPGLEWEGSFIEPSTAILQWGRVPTSHTYIKLTPPGSRTLHPLSNLITNRGGSRIVGGRGGGGVSGSLYM